MYQYSFELLGKLKCFIICFWLSITEVEPNSLSWQLFQFIFTGQLYRGQNCVGMGWDRTDASSNSPIMARFWHIIDGIEIYKKKE